MSQGTTQTGPYLYTERATLERLLPGLDDRLAVIELEKMEQRTTPAIDRFREAGGPGLLVAAEHGGAGASAVEAVRVQRALGARSPSLAVATTMHHFSVASLAELSDTGDGMEWAMLQAVSAQRLLLASAFAEGRAGQAILRPQMRAEEVDGAWVVRGAKKPCSLSSSMDVLTASVSLDDGSAAVAMIPATAPGLRVEPFWTTDILAGTQSDAVILDGVRVEPELLVPLGDGHGRLDRLQTVGFVWFELLMTASYLGAASGLAERVIGRPQADPVPVVSPLEMVAQSLTGIAARFDAGEDPTELLAATLHSRFVAQELIVGSAMAALEALGGMAFITDPSVTYLASACRALAFHPPSRAAAAPKLAAHLHGSDLEIS